MKILKRPDNLIFEPLHPNEPRQMPPDEARRLVGWIPLHHHDKRESDFEYLQKHFPPDNPIFERFGQSYFYIQKSE